ncbi:adenylate/guanylate cyclase domain-containing protein [Actinomycetaceae bacterium TAE3-ERU4]|nr:adenylate/guanylate cyclase domain-containing protein [Actinomycetaceae bacterium TAE3-ERU4]
MSEGTLNLDDSTDDSKEESVMQRLRNQLLGNQPCYTIKELAQLANVSLERAKDFWRAMGFANVAEDDLVFTRQDVDALIQSKKLLDSGWIDDNTLISLLRANSYTADRLALWQVEAVVEDCARRHDLDDVSARQEMLDTMHDLMPFLERQTRYAMRRHLFSLLERTHGEYGQRNHKRTSPGRYPLRRSLGFVDMVAYTSTSANLGANGLSKLIRNFEYTARDVITSRGARIVKNIGDAVFYIADDLKTATEVVCALVETFEQNPTLLPVRASLVEGFVVSRSGDVYGPPVNLASRLVDTAPKGSICVDAQTAKSISEASWGSGYSLTALEPAQMHGLGAVDRYSLARKILQKSSIQ